MRVSAPGRICLFGEHQDYLGLPVIPCAISLRLTVTGEHTAQGMVNIDLPDINRIDSFPLNCCEQPYSSESDYLRSCYNQLLRSGFSFSRGISCTITSDIPVNAGASSSSALVVAWLQFLSLMSDQHIELPAWEIALLAYLAEVEEFGQHGGMMDQYSSALGGVIHLSSLGRPVATPIAMNPGEIILADSGQPKNTQGLLGLVRSRAEDVLKKMPGVDIHSTALAGIESFPDLFFGNEFSLLRGILRNRDITEEALSAGSPSETGLLLTEEHGILRDVMGTSTDKIDEMVETAISSGAYGAKINGSGGGGCMFATVPSEKVDSVYSALEGISTGVWHVKPDSGVRIEH